MQAPRSELVRHPHRHYGKDPAIGEYPRADLASLATAGKMQR
jgi:hypothetical protein